MLLLVLARCTHFNGDDVGTLLLRRKYISWSFTVCWIRSSALNQNIEVKDYIQTKALSNIPRANKISNTFIFIQFHEFLCLFWVRMVKNNLKGYYRLQRVEVEKEITDKQVLITSLQPNVLLSIFLGAKNSVGGTQCMAFESALFLIQHVCKAVQLRLVG